MSLFDTETRLQIRRTELELAARQATLRMKLAELEGRRGRPPAWLVRFLHRRSRPAAPPPPEVTGGARPPRLRAPS